MKFHISWDFVLAPFQLKNIAVVNSSAKKKREMMAEKGTTAPPRDDTETEENNQPPHDNDMEDTAIVTPTEEMYLRDLNNTFLSQILKDGSEWGVEDKVIVECPKLKQYFNVDTLLVQAISGRVCLYTNDKIETFPIHCSKTNFSPSLLDKILKDVEKQRATPKNLPGENWPRKLKTILSRADLDKGWMHMQNYVICMQEIQLIFNMPTWSTKVQQMIT